MPALLNSPIVEEGKPFASCSRCHELVTDMTRYTGKAAPTHTKCLEARQYHRTKGHTPFCLATLQTAHERVFHLEPYARRVQAWKDIPDCVCHLEKSSRTLQRPLSVRGLVSRQAKADRQAASRKAQLKAWATLYPGMTKAQCPARWRPSAKEQARLQSVTSPAA